MWAPLLGTRCGLAGISRERASAGRSGRNPGQEPGDDLDGVWLPATAVFRPLEPYIFHVSHGRRELRPAGLRKDSVARAVKDECRHAEFVK